MEGESPGNFGSFDGPGDATGNYGDDQTDGMGKDVAGSAAGYALALLQVLYSYGGWENANYVSTTTLLTDCYERREEKC